MLGKCFWWFKHKIKYFEGKGYRCSRCGKPKSQCKEGKQVKRREWRKLLRGTSLKESIIKSMLLGGSKSLI